MKFETERLILRDFVEEDWGRVLEYQSDPLYLRYYEWTERTPEAAQEFVGWFLDQQKQTPRIKFQFAVTLKSNNLLIGNCGMRMDHANAFQAMLVTSWIPNIGITDMPPKPRMLSSILASIALTCIESGHGAWRIISARRTCWKNWECAGKDIYARTNTIATDGGIL